ncbi:hypothetical protein PR048_027552 [Dryococelus australis]|uniref:Uncharacterized protein n=1 Tax=Dryococelus australis TaxID=614101 RepID=A0ABQ9GGU6_9NEOP|nr:hypothetical protein PR048_027552 [Dryococelus australis]
MRQTGNTISCMISVNVRHLSSTYCDGVCLIAGKEPWTSSGTTLKGVKTTRTRTIPARSHECTQLVQLNGGGGAGSLRYCVDASLDFQVMAWEEGTLSGLPDHTSTCLSCTQAVIAEISYEIANHRNTLHRPANGDNATDIGQRSPWAVCSSCRWSHWSEKTTEDGRVRPSTSVNLISLRNHEQVAQCPEHPIVGPRAKQRRRNERAGETGDPRENPPNSRIVRHDSHMRKSGSDPAGDLTGFVWSSHFTTVAPLSTEKVSTHHSKPTRVVSFKSRVLIILPNNGHTIAIAASIIQITILLPPSLASSLLLEHSPCAKPNRVRFPASSPRSSDVGDGADVTVWKQVSSKHSRFPNPCIPPLLHPLFIKPSSTLETTGAMRWTVVGKGKGVDVWDGGTVLHLPWVRLVLPHWWAGGIDIFLLVLVLFLL